MTATVTSRAGDRSPMTGFVRTVVRMCDSETRPQKNARTKIVRVAAANGVSGSLLGPLLDNYHSQFGALEYVNPIYVGGLVTSWWTPPLFALAGLIIGNGTLLGDRYLPTAPEAPGLPKVLYTISAFTFQYYLSGVIYASGVSNGANFAVMSAVAAAIWYGFDRSATGIVLGFLTALGGPSIEVGIINLSGAYSYASPDWMGIPLWILPVYFGGAPAVGNLSRYFNQRL